MDKDPNAQGVGEVPIEEVKEAFDHHDANSSPSSAPPLPPDSSLGSPDFDSLPPIHSGFPKIPILIVSFIIVVGLVAFFLIFPRVNSSKKASVAPTPKKVASKKTEIRKLPVEPTGGAKGELLPVMSISKNLALVFPANTLVYSNHAEVNGVEYVVDINTKELDGIINPPGKKFQDIENFPNMKKLTLFGDRDVEEIQARVIKMGDYTLDNLLVRKRNGDNITKQEIEVWKKILQSIVVYRK